MIEIRKSTERDLDAIRALYASLTPNIRIGREIQVIAIENDVVLGIVRLVEEEGHLVLRGMNVREENQRHGVGKAMLKELEEHIEGRDCYCIPHSYLKEFYETIGFEQIPLDQAPEHLRKRHDLYLSMGLDGIIMKRSSLEG